MSEPNSPSDPTPPVPPAPSFTYGDPAPAPAAQPAAPPPAQAAPPQYGERVPGYENAPPYGAAAPAPAPAYGGYPGPGFGGPPVRQRRTWDVVLTIVLLVLGLGGLVFGLGAAAIFTDPLFAQQLEDTLGQQGLSGDFDFGDFPVVVAVSHIVLYLAAVGVSILLLVKRRIAFYVPLIAGVLAAIVFWAGYFVVIFTAVDVTSLTP